MEASLRKLRLALLVLIAGIAVALVVGAGCNTVDEFLDKDNRSSGGVDCYPSFGAFKRAMKRAGKDLRSNQQWHHIVNQNATNRRKFPDRLHCPDNLIALPVDIHRKINGHYSSKPNWTKPSTVRAVISAKSWSEQYEYGRRVLREHGVDL